MIATYDGTTGGGTVVGGLTHNTQYYIIRVDKDFIKVALNLTNANNGTAISFSG